MYKLQAFIWINNIIILLLFHLTTTTTTEIAVETEHITYKPLQYCIVLLLSLQMKQLPCIKQYIQG